MTIPNVRKKRKTTKVKTGCLTCRERRIKCDEGKPYCKRCCSSGRKCNWYTHTKAPSRLVQVLPAPTANSSADLCPNASIIRPSPLLSPRLEPTEGEALAFFYRHTAARLGRCLQSEIWSRLVLQLAQQDSVILDAVVAVGSLHRASWLTESIFTAKDDRPSHQRFALNRYSRAMLQLRSNMANALTAYPEHVILISCLLFVCFESLQESQPAVRMHLQNGLRIIHDVFRSELEFATTYHSAVVLRGANKDAIDDLISIFSRLDYDASRLGSGRPLIALSEDNDEPASSRPLPIVFESISTARSSLDSLAVDLNTLQTLLFDLATKAVSADPNAPSELGARQAYMHALTRFVRLDSLEEAFKRRHAELMHKLEQFDVAMAKSMKSSTWKQNPETIPLQLQSFLVHFLAANLRNIHESKCDAFMPTFERMITLAEQYTSSQQTEPEATSNPSFHLQKSMLRTIYLIAMKCREPEIRRKAITLLRSAPFQETMWNSAAYALHMERLMELEENDLQIRASKANSTLRAADIPERARFCDVLIAGSLTNSGAARFVFAKYLHDDSISKYPKIAVLEEED